MTNTPDAISRGAAVEALRAFGEENTSYKYEMSRAIDIIAALPSLPAEPREGR